MNVTEWVPFHHQSSWLSWLHAFRISIVQKSHLQSIYMQFNSIATCTSMQCNAVGIFSETKRPNHHQSHSNWLMRFHLAHCELNKYVHIHLALNPNGKYILSKYFPSVYAYIDAITHSIQTIHAIQLTKSENPFINVAMEIFKQANMLCSQQIRPLHISACAIEFYRTRFSCKFSLFCSEIGDFHWNFDFLPKIIIAASIKFSNVFSSQWNSISRLKMLNICKNKKLMYCI